MINPMSMMHLIPLIMLIAFMLQQSHLLMSLLMLEGIMLSLVFIIPVLLSWTAANISFSCILLLSIGACEAAMGLALLVMMSRSTGTDMISLMSINKC